MPYIKTTWNEGAAPGISAANLNNLETQYDAAVAELDARIQKLSEQAYKSATPVDKIPDASEVWEVGFNDAWPAGGGGYVVTLKQRGNAVFDDFSASFHRQVYYPRALNGIYTRYANTNSKPAWVASTAYAVNDLVMPTSANENGHYYKCTTAGTSSSTEPTWPTASGATVADGTVVWTESGKFWSDWVQLLDSSDTTRVKVDGGIPMTGNLESNSANAHFKGLTGIAIFSSKNGSYLASNAYFDGTNWLRYDTSQPAAIILNDRAGTIKLYTAAAAANPITWAGPYYVWHSGNDGAGSGLDADMVDGYHASSFAKFAAGTYTGDSTTGRAINVGFAPLYVVVQTGTVGTNYHDIRATFSSQVTIERYRQQSDGQTYTGKGGNNLTATGFTIPNIDANNGMNTSAVIYDYIAWG